MASADGNTDTTNDGNTGGVVRDNYCCYPCFNRLQDGTTFTECGPAGFNADNLYSDDGNINVPNQVINGDYYYDKDGTPDNCIMREIGCKKHILGCTSTEASNYNESATKDNGTCIFTETYIQTVCGDESAINYVEPNGTTKIACPNNTCCQYEVEQSDPVGCGCETDKLILQSEIETIAYEIEVLTQQREEIIEENNNSFVPDTNSGYNSYIPYSYINADIQTENTNVIFEDVTNEGVYRKYTATDITGDIETDFNSLSGNPDLSDSSRWVPIIDGNGIVSFTLNDVDVEYDTLILSHNTQEKAGANLYKQFCTSKGYVFSTFYIDTQTGKQIQFIPNRDNINQTNNALTQKCVDPSYILCDDVADIKMVFGSNQWSGFNLPEDNGDTDVEISMDVMVRFNADTLLNDCLVSTCGEPLININGIYDTECQNYIVFADNSDTRKLFNDAKYNSYITDSETGQRKWIYGSESISLWQTPGLQNEPSVECCEAFGGEVVESQSYLNDGKTLNLNEFDRNFSADQKNHIDTLDKIKNSYDEYGKESLSCGNLSYNVYQYKGCESNYADLITTENICSITPPEECLIYSILLQEYETIIKQLNINIRETSICANEYDQTQKLINDLDSKIIEQQTYINQSKAEKKTLESQQTSFYLRKTLQIQVLESQKEDEERKLESPNISDNEKIIIISTIEDLDRQIKDLEEERKQGSRNDNTTIENIESEISQREDCITEFINLRSRLKKENSQKSCCKSLLKRFTSLNSDAVEESSIVNSKAQECYAKWQETIYNNYNEWLSSQSINVLQFMEDTSINLTLEVDNSLGTTQNNRVTKYTTLDSYTTDINPVWEFDPTGGYTGVLLEGSEPSVNIVKDSVNTELISRGEDGNNAIFDEQWQKVRFVLNDSQCTLLRDLYPNKQFFIGLSINNERNCETTLLVDNIQINTDINFLQKEYSTDNCLSFDLSCMIDDKKSWVFTDGLVKTAYENQDIRCNPLPTDKKLLTFPKPQERYSGNLEYRYTDYSVNHSKLVLNSKETSFRIDPANAIECDVYNFWQEIDCDECNTLFSCATATTLTYTNPTGGTLPLSGASCSSFDCNAILSDIKYSSSIWKEILAKELNDYTLAKNMSFSVMNNTKDKPKGNQKVSNEPYVNVLFKNQNINNYDVSYFLPKSLGVGFDIQKSDCNSDIIEIKKINEDVYTLISEETDGTLGFYSYTADTNDICELTSFVDEQCCNNVSGYLDRAFKINKPNYGWVDGTCRWKKDDSIENNCDSDCAYYGTQVEETKFIYSGSSGVTLSSTCVDTPVCIKPLDYLDKQPNEVNIKPNFDTMVLSNLIDVKSRQVISDYPMLRLFYNQYLNANGCGASITNRLDYNTTFEVMDLIGDYWTDIIEQVVPATTIWDGHNNSGKVYRNTIFDQNKFPYKRYVLNYYDGECEINEITRDAIAINTGSTINLTESCLRGECFGSDLKECTEEQKAIQKALQEQIKALEDAIDRLENSDVENKETILELQRGLLEIKQRDLDKQKEECEGIEETASENQSASSELNNCDVIAKQLNEEEEKLTTLTEGTLSYQRQKAFVDTLRIRYESCKRKSNINITQYTTMFITQMYDSNEYEGDVNVFGDPDWDSDVELLHACGSMEYICPEKPSSENRTIFKWGKNYEYSVFVDENGNDITNKDCCSKLNGSQLSDDAGNIYCLPNGA